MEVKGWTLEELAKKLGMSKNSTQKRIERERIIPIFSGSIYPPDTYERIKAKQPGRPKKPSPEDQKKPRKTPK
jgi:transcriptional regulator with XRE-family HTH domain